MRRVLWAIFLALSVSRPAGAANEIDLYLVLAVDASGSVNQTRYDLQMRGYAAAFRNPRVLQAIRSNPHQAIAVTMIQWTGPRLQARVIDWTVIRDEASARGFGDTIEGTLRRLFSGGTSISGAIDFAQGLFPDSADRARRVIDVSGDGSNNAGRPVTIARDDAVRSGTTINGLPIVSIEPDLEAYYRDYVVGGPGAFVISADSYETFGEAILTKLVTEIAALPPDLAPSGPNDAGSIWRQGDAQRRDGVDRRAGVEERYILARGP